MNIENIKKAIAVLRDRSKWPNDFEWDYTKIEKCACALLPKVLDFGSNDLCFVGSYEIADYLGIKYSEAQDIFIFCRHLNGKDWEDTTPEDVADALEKLL